MNIAEYKKKASTVKETPGGLFVCLKKMRVRDLLFIQGSVPDVITTNDPEHVQVVEPGAPKINAEKARNFSKYVLCNCVILVDRDGNPTGEKIVEADTTTDPKEISYSEIEMEDSNFIIEQVNVLSGLTKKEEAKASAPFSAVASQ